MGFREFSGELDAPTSFREFDGELDQEQPAEGGLLAQSRNPYTPSVDTEKTAAFKEFSPIAASFVSGTTKLGQTILDTPKFAADVVNEIAVNPFLHLFGKDLGPAKRMEFAQDLEAVSKELTTDLRNKPVEDLGLSTPEARAETASWIAQQAAAQSPQMVGGAVASFVPKLRNAYLGFMAATSGADSNVENQREGVDDQRRVIGAVTNGAWEAVGEALPFEVFDKVGDMIKRLPDSEKAAFISDITKKTLAATAAMTAQHATEGVGEMVTQAGQNWTQRDIIGDKSVDIGDGVLTAGAIGAIMATPTSVAHGVQAFRDDHRTVPEMLSQPKTQPSDILTAETTDEAIQKFAESVATEPDAVGQFVAENADAIQADELLAEPAMAQATGASFQPTSPAEQPAPSFNPATAEAIDEIQPATQPQPDLGAAPVAMPDNVGGLEQSGPRAADQPLGGDTVPQRVDAAAQGGQAGGAGAVFDGGTAQPAGSVVFSDPYEVRRNKWLEIAKEHGVSEAALDKLAPQDERDHVTGFFKAEDKAPTIDRALRHVEETGQRAHFVEADISNLGGLNSHFKNNHDQANRVYRQISDIFREEMEAAGAKAVPIRHGGDEFNAIVIGGTSKSISAAMEKTHSRVADLMKQQGLDQIPHPKDLNKRGVGVYLGSSEITPGKTKDEIFAESSHGLNEGKIKGVNHVNQSQTGTTGNVAPVTAGAEQGKPGISQQSQSEDRAARIRTVTTPVSKRDQAPAGPVEPQPQAESKPVFGTNSAGKITMRGVPMEKIQAVRDKLGMKGVIIGKDNAVFPKGTDLKILQAAFDVAPAPSITKPKKPVSASTDLLGRIKQLGGINSKYASDVTGEQKPKGAWKFAFGKNGLGLDDLASQLAAEGFTIDLNDPTDNGGVNQISEMIRRHIGGERAFKATTQEAQAEAMAEDRDYVAMRKRAEELGIKVKGLGNNELADAIYAAEDAIKMDAIAEREALQAEAAEINDLADMIEDGQDVPFGDEVQTDDAALAAFLGEQNENDQTGSRGAGEGAGEQAGQGAERGARTGSEPQGSESPLLESYTNAEVLKREAAAAKAAEEAAREPAAKPVTADQADLFNTQDSLFNSNRESSTAQDGNVKREPASWVIKNKQTGEVIMETFDKKKVDALNTEKYEAVPIGEHLASLNTGTYKETVEKNHAAKKKLEVLKAQAAELDTRFKNGIIQLKAIPKNLKIANPESGKGQYNARKVLTAANQRVEKLDALRRCLG